MAIARLNEDGMPQPHYPGWVDTPPLVKIEHPCVPVAKGRPRSKIVRGRHGAPFIQVYTPKETVAFEKDVAWQAKASMRDKQPFDGALAARITILLPVPLSWSKPDRDAAAAGYIWPASRPDWGQPRQKHLRCLQRDCLGR